MIWTLALAGCLTDDSYIEGFSPPAASEGYTRMVAPPVLGIAPGTDATYCQWLAEPSDVDRQIVNTEGYQSHGGHHMVLYGTTVHEPVGTTRICTDEDMLSIAFLGAVGGEGNNNAAKLPDGFAFGVPRGLALMANTHYYNATDEAFDAQSVADVKFGDPARPLATVGFYSVSWAAFSIPDGSSDFTSDAYCTATQKLSFFMWTNHMHEHGVSMFSEVIRSDGTVLTMARDDSWSPEQAFNAPWVRWDPAAPIVVNPGDQYRVSCTWHNTTGADLRFPREMCVASGFSLEEIPHTACVAKPAS